MKEMIHKRDAINILRTALVVTKDQERRGAIIEALYDLGGTSSLLPAGWTREQALKALIMSLKSLDEDDWRLVVQESTPWRKK
jgi:hypothetical protein|tara:strand:- start:150 stop:398 length:249 start_codon:yes stop_codon:yes gene_type:complete